MTTRYLPESLPGKLRARVDSAREALHDRFGNYIAYEDNTWDAYRVAYEDARRICEVWARIFKGRQTGIRPRNLSRLFDVGPLLSLHPPAANHPRFFPLLGEPPTYEMWGIHELNAIFLVRNFMGDEPFHLSPPPIKKPLDWTSEPARVDRVHLVPHTFVMAREGRIPPPATSGAETYPRSPGGWYFDNDAWFESAFMPDGTHLRLFPPYGSYGASDDQAPSKSGILPAASVSPCLLGGYLEGSS